MLRRHSGRFGQTPIIIDKFEAAIVCLSAASLSASLAVLCVGNGGVGTRLVFVPARGTGSSPFFAHETQRVFVLISFAAATT
jgi:hypothetical protein